LSGGAGRKEIAGRLRGVLLSTLSTLKGGLAMTKSNLRWNRGGLRSKSCPGGCRRPDQCTARFILPRRTVSATFSWPKTLSSASGFFYAAATKRALCTNMPPEPQADRRFSHDRLNHLNDELTRDVGGEKLAAFLPFTHREVAQKVLVDLQTYHPLCLSELMQALEQGNSVALSR